MDGYGGPPAEEKPARGESLERRTFLPRVGSRVVTVQRWAVLEAKILFTAEPHAVAMLGARGIDTQSALLVWPAWLLSVSGTRRWSR